MVFHFLKSLKNSLLLALALLFLTNSFAGEPMTLTYEYATSVNGPWTKVDPASVQVSPIGAITVEVDGRADVFFRMRVVSGEEATSIPVVTLGQIPTETLAAARNHLARFVATGGEAGEAWEDVDLAPFATPLSESANLEKPSHYEFKLSRRLRTATETGFRKFDSDEDGDTARGYLICSANKNDLPIVEFSTEGDTPVERLLRKCGGVAPARIVRYGAGFWVAENERGELIANHGTEPFRPPAQLAELMGQVHSGNADTETGQDERPPDLKLQPEFYRDYREFKADFESNEIYKKLRDRRAENAKAFWDAERGVYPQVLAVDLGETENFLAGTQIDALIVDTESGERVIANVSVLRAGGLRVEGLIAGRMGIKVRIGEAGTRYVIAVQARIAGASSDKKSEPVQAAPPFWKTAVEKYAGGWSDQMRWKQLKDSDWCQAVGCGPAALGMLLGWWENENSVESAFYSELNFSSISMIDAPQFLDTTANKAKVKGAYRQLHELCDVICDPFSDAGATMPSDLIEGFFGYIHPVASSMGIASLVYGQGSPLVGYSFSWAYDFWGDDWDSSGSRVANGIIAGRPGVVGLGWLWHYVVAYGYMRQDYTVTINGNDQFLGLRRRYFKCNEGWGKDSPAWYSAYDVFLGLSVNMWQKKAPTQP